SRRRHTRSKRDWSSDVCSSDLSFMSASAYCFLMNLRLHPIRQTGRFHLASRGRIGFTCVTAHRFAARGFARKIAPPCARLATCRIGNLRSEEHTSELQSRFDLVCRLLLEKKKNTVHDPTPPAPPDPALNPSVRRGAPCGVGGGPRISAI